METFILLLIYLLQMYKYGLFIYVILTWVPNLRGTRFFDFFEKLYRPILSTFERLIPPIGGISFSAIFVFLLIDLVIRILIGF